MQPEATGTTTGVASRLQDIRDAISSVAAATPGATQQGDPNILKSWWRNWPNWHNGWGNGGWHNWRNGWHNWGNGWHNW
jgi:hypothetical protein